MPEQTKLTYGEIKHQGGIAGQEAYSVEVTYPGEAPRLLTFVGSLYGGPVMLVTAAFPGGTRVDQPERFGVFNEEWVHLFLAN